MEEKLLNETAGNLENLSIEELAILKFKIEELLKKIDELEKNFN